MARATGAGALDPPRSRASRFEREATATAEPARVRHHEIDRLRILAVLLLFPFHAARVFNEMVAIHRAALRQDIGRPWMLFAAPVAFMLLEALPGPEGAWNPS